MRIFSGDVEGIQTEKEEFQWINHSQHRLPLNSIYRLSLYTGNSIRQRRRSEGCAGGQRPQGLAGTWIPGQAGNDNRLVSSTKVGIYEFPLKRKAICSLHPGERGRAFVILEKSGTY